MKNSELIELLSQYPGDMEVLREDYEADHAGITSVRREMYPTWSKRVAAEMKKHGLEPKEVLVIE